MVVTDSKSLDLDYDEFHHHLPFLEAFQDRDLEQWSLKTNSPNQRPKNRQKRRDKKKNNDEINVNNRTCANKREINQPLSTV